MFKDFITGGNVIEFAVAVIMAGAWRSCKRICK